MTGSRAFLPVLALLLSTSAGCAGAGDAPSTDPAAGIASAEAAAVEPPAQATSPPKPPRDGASDQDVLDAMRAVERAETYEQLLQAVERHEDVIGSTTTVALVDRALANEGPGSEQRGMLVLERQLSLDCRREGGRAAARLLAVRLIAASALSADSVEQLAAVLEKFAPLARELNPAVVRTALAAPADTWPAPLLPLLEQLARDWPAHGALAAATRRSRAAGSAEPRPSAGGSAQPLTGHWRSTEIVFDSPRDEHLVLHADGSAETWIVTASSTAPRVRGRWRVQETTLTVNWEDGRQWGQPFTFHDGSLVFPNVPGRRQVWEKIE